MRIMRIINFWDIFNKIFIDSSDNAYSDIIKLQFIRTIIDKTNTLEEIKPLIDSLNTKNANAEHIILLILKSIVATINPKEEKFVLSNKQMLIWLEFIDKILPNIKFSHIKHVDWILYSFAIKATENQEIFNKCGEISRKIYNWSLNVEEEELKNYINSNISRLIICTYESNPEQSKNIFEELITKKLFSFHYFLYNKLNQVLEHDPDYISSVYKYVIGSIEEQGNKLVVINSLYKSSLHYLDEFNKKYIEKQGFEALKTLLKSLNAFAFSERSASKSAVDGNNFIKEEYIERFYFKEKPVTFITDFSHIWGDNEYIYTTVYGLITDVFQYISQFDKENDIDQVIELFTKYAYCADLWRRLLKVIANNPKLYEKYLPALLLNRTFQLSSDTQKVYGKLLKASLPLLIKQQIKLIEQFIIDLPCDNEQINKFSSSQRISIIKSYIYMRNNLIDLFPEESLTLEKSKKIKQINKAKNKDYSAYLETRDGLQMSSRPIGKYEWYEIQGIKPNDQEREIIDLFEPLEEFNNNWLNAAPDIDSIKDIMPNLLKLYDKVKEQNNLNKDLYNDGWKKIGETLSSVCMGSYSFQHEKELKGKIKELIYECIKISSIPFDDNIHEKDYLNFRTPANKSVEALVHYYRFIHDKNIFQELKILAKNKDSSIRNNIIYAIFRFNQINTDFFELIKIIIDNDEPIFEIIQMIFAFTLKQILIYEKEVKEIIEIIETKYPDQRINLYKRDIYFDTVGLFVNLSVYYHNEWATEKLYSFFEDIENYSVLYYDIVFSAFNNIRFDESNKLNDDKKKDITDRFSKLINKLFETMSDNLPILKDKYIDDENKRHIIAECISMFFLKILSINEDKPELRQGIQEETLKKLDSTLKNIYKILKVDELFHKNPSNVANYLRFTNATLNDSNIKENLNNVNVLSKYIEKINYKLEDSYLYSQVTSKFISFISEINDNYIKEIKVDKDSLSKFVDIINKLAKTDDPEAIRLIWRLK